MVRGKALYLLDSIGVFTIGHAFAEFGRSKVAAPERDGTDTALRKALQERGGLTHWSRVVSETGPHDYDEEFETGLAALLDGFDRLLQRRDA